MKISPEYQAKLAAKKGQIIAGENYSVKLITPIALQYLTALGSITLDIELFGEGTRWWWPRSYLAIYVEYPLHWDNSELPMQANESAEIISQIEVAVKKLGWRYRFLERASPQDRE